ncbi:hypothetical protein [Streptomyces avidinii]|uniref:Type VII secretion system (Wss) protein ESAT-6 n=1 Tax=Streptomyces avidinii TaxID=1895 RepID=A0ABS4KWQ2_STRAV|nr:hypothetical protein [Streptomyces avidinii]MBP2034459.1 hypothetical protein [Streptomyces avidinii]GGY86407.1 hypothetical protein GCM10010343_09230 [Streptomyces avidinii]
MRNHADRDDRAAGVELTTEDIANPGAPTGAAAAAPDARADEGRQVPTYPGEATADTRGEGSADQEAAVGHEDERPPAADEPLLGTEEAEGYRRSWSAIQGRFVDDPQDAVKSADALVAEVMQALAQTFSSRKQGLEGQWDQGEQVATEELRLALQQYRSFFNRLLNT